MADPTPPAEGPAAQMVAEISAVRKDLRDLAGPSGTQRSRVLADLSGRSSSYARDRAYYRFWSKSGSDPDPPAVANEPFGPVLEFVMRERRLVRLTMSVNSSATFTALNETTSGYASLDVTMAIDGVGGIDIDQFDSVYSQIGTGSPAFRTSRDAKRMRVEQYVEMDPGSHTVQAQILTLAFAPSPSGSWSGFADLAAPFISVDVLQPLD